MLTTMACCAWAGRDVGQRAGLAKRQHRKEKQQEGKRGLGQFFLRSSKRFLLIAARDCFVVRHPYPAVSALRPEL